MTNGHGPSKGGKKTDKTPQKKDNKKVRFNF